MTGGYRLGRRPALDGLRGVAVLLVVYSHSLPGRLDSGGAIGVTLFFVLSGFLITRLLIEELERTGRIDLRTFYARRARRLLPALTLLLAVVALILAATGQPLYEVLLGATYLTNVMYAQGASLSWLPHLWSLALEEQFYLMWPVVLIVARRRALPLAVGALVVLEVWRGWGVYDQFGVQWLRFSPDMRAGALLLGCILAFTIGRVLVPFWAVMLATSALVLECAVIDLASSAFLLPASIASTVLVAWAATGSRAGLAWRWLRYVGQISYGIYLWHFPVAIVANRWLPWWLALLTTLGVSLVIATLSWRCVEEPLLRGHSVAAVARDAATVEPSRPSDSIPKPSTAPAPHCLNDKSSPCSR